MNRCVICLCPFLFEIARWCNMHRIHTNNSTVFNSRACHNCSTVNHCDDEEKTILYWKSYRMNKWMRSPSVLGMRKRKSGFFRAVRTMKFSRNVLLFSTFLLLPFFFFSFFFFWLANNHTIYFVISVSGFYLLHLEQQ